jgi:hypothetical protein
MTVLSVAVWRAVAISAGFSTRAPAEENSPNRSYSNFFAASNTLPDKIFDAAKNPYKTI